MARRSMTLTGTTTFWDRCAAAPISWGVCEADPWGHQMSPARVLREMRELRFTKTELGPAGFLPTDTSKQQELLGVLGLELVGGFVPLAVTEHPSEALQRLQTVINHVKAAGGTQVVLSADTGRSDYDRRPVLNGDQWRVFLQLLNCAKHNCAQGGLQATLHPHMGTFVQTPREIERVLNGCDISLCLDTGHIRAGGGDPLELARAHPYRIGHVHLKDVDGRLAAQVRAGEISYAEAVRRGMYVPLGQGDVETEKIIRTLEAAGYTGSYVLEQDVMLAEEPPEGKGPIVAVRQSLAFLERVSRGLPAAC
jgi:inosose dehydratase